MVALPPPHEKKTTPNPNPLPPKNQHPEILFITEAIFANKKWKKRETPT